MGSVTVDIALDDGLQVEEHHELFLLLTTESLFEGLKYIEENMKYVSRYVFLPVGTKTYTFRNVHPGTYYLYSYNDIHNDKRHKHGDYMSSNIHNSFTLAPRGHVKVDTEIDFIIP